MFERTTGTEESTLALETMTGTEETTDEATLVEEMRTGTEETTTLVEVTTTGTEEATLVEETITGTEDTTTFVRTEETTLVVERATRVVFVAILVEETAITVLFVTILVEERAVEVLVVTILVEEIATGVELAVTTADVKVQGQLDYNSSQYCLSEGVHGVLRQVSRVQTYEVGRYILGDCQSCGLHVRDLLASF